MVLRVMVVGAVAALLGGAIGELSGGFAGTPVLAAETSSEFNNPRRHYRISHPARLTPVEAEKVYQGLAASLIAGYRAGGHPVAATYRSWRRVNTAPYLSAAHGNLYLNNYINGAAAAYGRFEKSGTLPVGAVIAKESFIVERTGEVRPGPLFIMEKMPERFNYVSGDWRYTEIQPDGTLFGETRGAGAERVEYCIACHLARERYDHLFFVPEAYRTPAPEGP